MIELAVELMSLSLAVLAIWLSIKLYRMSESGARRMREAQSAVQQSVQQLDRMFERMYSDTWSLVRDSYQHMHQQLWEQVRTGAGHPVPRPRQRMSTGQSVDSDAGGQRETGDAATTGERSAVGTVILDTYQRLSRAGTVVRAGDVATAAARQGYPTVVVLDALYDLTLVQRRLLLAEDRFVPESAVAETPDELRRALRAMADLPSSGGQDERGGGGGP